MTKKIDPDLADFDDEMNASEDGSGGSHEKQSKPSAKDALTHPSYEQLLQELTQAEEKFNQQRDQTLRVQADLENIRRRHEKDLASAHKYGLERIAQELLSVVDNLERGLAQMPVDAAENLRTGVELTLKQLTAVLDKFSIKVIDPLETQFDPTFHEAMAMKESTKAPGIVLEVLQKGYQLHDRLLRPALVVVSKGPPQQ